MIASFENAFNRTKVELKFEAMDVSKAIEGNF